MRVGSQPRLRPRAARSVSPGEGARPGRPTGRTRETPEEGETDEGSGRHSRGHRARQQRASRADGDEDKAQTLEVHTRHAGLVLGAQEHAWAGHRGKGTGQPSGGRVDGGSGGRAEADSYSQSRQDGVRVREVRQRPHELSLVTGRARGVMEKELRVVPGSALMTEERTVFSQDAGGRARVLGKVSPLRTRLTRVGKRSSENSAMSR